MTPSRVQLRRDVGVARAVREWRDLTGGRARGQDAARATLVGCSGGADSSALAIALASTPARIVLGHVVHDLRSRADALADRDAVRDLASRLGAEFREASVRVRTRGTREPGNAEARARRARYAALSGMAGEAECRYVAVAHHADDQLETMLMQMLRGRRGPAGAARTRPLRAGGTLVRPMLDLTRADCERICRAAGWSWREDSTNADTTRLRAALRARVLPILRELAPEGARRASRAADLARRSEQAIADWAAGVPRSVVDGAIVRERAALAALPEGVRAAVVLGDIARATGRAGATAGRVLDEIARACVEPDPRTFDVAGGRVSIDRARVRVARS